MKKITFLFLILIFSTSLFAQKVTEETATLIEVWLEAQKDFEQLPGISAIAIKDQEVVWEGASGMANPENMVQTTPETIGSICSISKLFTAVAIMKLYDEGKLRLDDTVEELLPWYNLEQKYPDSSPVTVRAMLSHSSGLPREANYPYWTSPDFPFPSREEVRSGLADQETLYPASTYFQYSNLGLTLLGEIVEEVSGQDYDTYIRENILEPLQLDNTRTELPESMYGEQLAVGYSSVNRAGNREKVNFFQANGIKAAAGFSSTVEDLGSFASWQFRIIDTSATEILKGSTLRYMQNVHWTDPDFETMRGLGFGVYKGPDQKKWVGHGGSCPGYRSTLMLSAESKKAYAVIINASGTNPSKYAFGINAIIEKAEKDKGDEENSADLSEYTGRYDISPWGSEEYVGQMNGRLVTMSLPTNDPAGSMTFYKHIEGDIFRRVRDNGEMGEELVFERDDNGMVVRMLQHNNYSKRIQE